MTSTGERKRHQRNLIACLGCRTIKIRCLDNEDQVTPCQRCQRLGIPCVYARKRPRQSVKPSRSTLRLGSGVSDTADPVDPVEHVHRVDHVEFIPNPLPENLAPPPESRRGARVFDTSTYLDPDISQEEQGTIDPGASVSPMAHPPGAQPHEDPISMHLISEFDARNLIDLFHRHLNPVIALMDPKLHTVDYLRSTSSTLFSAVLTASAKFFRRQLYPDLLAHTQLAVNRATSLGTCNVGIIQALLIMLYWKAPRDGSLWVKMGIAIRLGYQLGLHIPRTKPLPEDVLEARIMADAERTWIVISCFDRLFSDVFGLPTTVRLEEVPETETWARETARFHYGDMHNACSMSSASTYLMWIKYRRSLSTLPNDFAWSILNDLYTQYDRHLQRWFPGDPSLGEFSANEQTMLKWFDLNHLVKMKFHMLDVCPSRQTSQITTDWLGLAIRFTDQTEHFEHSGCLPYLPDTSAIHLSTFGIMCHRIFWRLDEPAKNIVIGLVRRMSDCCQAHAEETEAVLTLVGRFMRKLLAVLEAQTATQAARDEFLRMTFPSSGTLGQTEDEQFWTMLFANTSAS
ncbi:hypothetical protein EHS25_000338 [Saitozyma podzolica]|uniref:Zn(2)-C6 fungal-type domain-containing protein n=1 Tax=Saitozyma podzolica TaxID=1890683 RepID=A0A427YVZ7_9TREE|nr:hypothetical protein EHS25_000338 [Saitozyma podzolica]